MYGNEDFSIISNWIFYGRNPDRVLQAEEWTEFLDEVVNSSEAAIGEEWTEQLGDKDEYLLVI